MAVNYYNLLITTFTTILSLTFVSAYSQEIFNLSLSNSSLSFNTMASASLFTLTGAPEAKIPRKSYTREFKLSVAAFYNLYRTSKYFSLNTNTVLRWVANETKITESPKHSKHCVPIRRAHHPQMEAALVREFKELREKGLKVRGYWFKVRARQLLQQIEPGSTFQFSDGWFNRFKARQNITLSRSRNTAQTPAEDKLSLIRGFHHTIQRLAEPTDDMQFDVGQFKLSQVANMDQTPLHYPSPSPVVRPTTPLGRRLFGSVVGVLAWTSGNVQSS